MEDKVVHLHDLLGIITDLLVLGTAWVTYRTTVKKSKAVAKPKRSKKPST
jgi:hypothetical protein